MGDRLTELEERLEQLVPRALSEDARVRMEDEIDRLTEGVAVPSSPSSNQRALVALASAACLILSLVLFFIRPAAEPPTVETTGQEAGSGPAVEYLGSQFYVTEMTDDGWGLEDGAEQPVRYWISMVTETEELLDNESGYQVRVVSEREMVEPIALTHL